MGSQRAGHDWATEEQQIKQATKDYDLASLHMGLSLPSPPSLILAHIKTGRKLHPYNGALFSHKKELATDTCYNVDKVWKHYAR